MIQFQLGVVYLNLALAMDERPPSITKTNTHVDKSLLSNLTVKVKSTGMKVSESFLVQSILNSLPAKFGRFQVNYNTLKEI
ncbi:hypothetical protein CR513_53591, partial [Mucuna pruriens]